MEEVATAFGLPGDPEEGQSASSSILRLDTELAVLSLDQEAGTLLGVAPESLLGRKLEDVADLADLANLMKSGTVFHNQAITFGKRRVACNYLPIVEDGRLTGGVLALLKQLPDPRLVSSDDPDEILRSAAAYVDLDYDGIVIVNREGIVVTVNQAFADVLDIPPQAIIGKHVHHAYPNSQSSRLPAVMETATPQLGITHYLNGKQVYASLYPLIKESRVIGGIGKILFKDVREITLIANRLQSAPETRALAETVARKGASSSYDINSLVGKSRKMVELKETLLRVAGKRSNVLLRGESGTGKELFAHALHAASERRYAQFVKVNCAAIPEHLLESELFGYAEGAFTGARKGGQVGKFEQAHTGTIFLDEIGDMPLYMQAKMLRVLQEKELTQLGSSTAKKVDVRVVAATNSNLEQLVTEGKFRADLYYRLNVVTLTIPSLRERMEDVPALTSHFIDQFNAEFSLRVQGVDEDARDIIMRYQWPGNVRELKNVIESAFNAVAGPLIKREHLPEQLSQMFSAAPPAETPPDISRFIRQRLGRKPLEQIMDEFEKMLLLAAVESSRGNKLRAADLLGISRQWLYKKLQKHAATSAPE